MNFIHTSTILCVMSFATSLAMNKDQCEKFAQQIMKENSAQNAFTKSLAHPSCTKHALTKLVARYGNLTSFIKKYIEESGKEEEVCGYEDCWMETVYSKNTPMHQAAASANPEAVEWLIENDHPVDVFNDEKDVPLRKAFSICNKSLTGYCSDKVFAVVKKLVEHGADVNQQLFHLFNTHVNADIADFLVQHGADPNMRDKQDLTAIFYARDAKDVKKLMSLGADVNAEVIVNDWKAILKKGSKPFNLWLKRNDASFFKELLDANIITKDQLKGNLRIALYEKNYGTTELLCDEGVEVTADDIAAAKIMKKYECQADISDTVLFGKCQQISKLYAKLWAAYKKQQEKMAYEHKKQ